MKGKTSNISPCLEGFWKILRISRDERRNSRVTYVSGGKLRLTLNHKFTNHARFSVKFTRQVLNFGLNQASRVNAFGALLLKGSLTALV